MARLKIKSLRKLVQLSKEIAPSIAAAGTRHFKRNFRLEGYYSGLVFKPWKDRAKPEPGRKILKQSGALQRSIRVTSQKRYSVTFMSRLPYSSVHNKGYSGTQSVKSYTRKIKRKTKTGRKGKPKEQEVDAHTRKQNIPKRTFMNANKKLEKEILAKIKKELKKLL